MTRIWLLAIVFAAIARPAEAETRKVAFALSGARRLTVGSCGCALASMGGLAREFNLLKDWASKRSDSERITLFGGSMFKALPNASGTGEEAQSPERFVGAMNLMQVTALGVAGTDVTIGPDALARLEKIAAFPFLSANIYYRGRPAFRPFLTKEIRGDRVTIVALSESPQVLPPGYEVRPPRETLHALLAGIDRPGMIALISTIPAEEVSRWIGEFPAVKLWLDAREGDQGWIEAQGNRRVYAWPRDRGREIAFVDIELDSARDALLMTSTNNARADELSKLEWRLRTVQKKMRSRSKGQRERDIKFLTKQIEDLRSVVVGEPATAMAVEASIEPVSALYDGPENEMGRWLVRR